MVENKTLVFDIVGTIIPYAGSLQEPREGIEALIKEYHAWGNSIFLATSDSIKEGGALMHPDCIF